MTAGFGIEGDRHAVSEGVRTARQVLLMDEETLGKFGLNSGDVRENITTSGIDLHTIEAGQQVSLGDSAVVEITGFCTPCARNGRDPGRAQSGSGRAARDAGDRDPWGIDFGRRRSQGAGSSRRLAEPSPESRDAEASASASNLGSQGDAGPMFGLPAVWAADCQGEETAPRP